MPEDTNFAIKKVLDKIPPIVKAMLEEGYQNRPEEEPLMVRRLREQASTEKGEAAQQTLTPTWGRFGTFSKEQEDRRKAQ